MLGTDELGLTVKWKFCFRGQGETVDSEPGNIFIDLGNKLEKGVIDHHHFQDSPLCTTSAIVRNPRFVLDHLLGPLNETYYGGKGFGRGVITFQFTTHREPDWDGAAAYYLVDLMVSSGGLPDPEVASALSKASETIDQGLAQMKGDPVRPFLVYLMLMNSIKDGAELLEKGKRIIGDIVEQKGRKITSGDFLNPYEPPAEFAPMKAGLERDLELFDVDKMDSEVFDIFVPKRDEVSAMAKAFYFKRPPACVMAKYWVRETNEQAILIVPQYDKEEERISRVIISVDPHSSFHLPGLGYELELRESEKRSTLGMERVGEPRYPDYCDNNDPWYDGRGHDFTIVDSPRGGTVLDYGEVIDCVRDLYGKPLRFERRIDRLDAFISYRRQGGADTVWALYSRLAGAGKRLFFDVESMKTGPFDEQILENVRKAPNFILVLSPGALDRCFEVGDWVAEEIRAAVNSGKNIIPVFKPDFTSPAGDALPAEIRTALRFDGVKLEHEYFEAGIAKILAKMK